MELTFQNTRWRSALNSALDIKKTPIYCYLRKVDFLKVSEMLCQPWFLNLRDYFSTCKRESFLIQRVFGAIKSSMLKLMFKNLSWFSGWSRSCWNWESIYVQQLLLGALQGPSHWQGVGQAQLRSAGLCCRAAFCPVPQTELGPTKACPCLGLSETAHAIGARIIAAFCIADWVQDKFGLLFKILLDPLLAWTK